MSFGIKYFRKTILLGVLFVCAASLFLAFAFPFLIEQSASIVSEDMEYALGSNYFNQKWAKAKMNTDSATIYIMSKCAQVAGNFEPTSRIPIRIAVIEDSTVLNACALPGGIIVLYRGILNMMDNQDELMALLAHETGHIYLRHGLKKIVRETFLGFLTGMLIRNSEYVFRVLAGQSGMLLNLSYDRREEEAADEFALQALSKAKLNPEGLISLFEKLRAQGTEEPPAILSTHPAMIDRIETIRSVMVTTISFYSVLSEEEWDRLRNPRAENSNSEYPRPEKVEGPPGP
jgi:predicted Zn-dependent protease